jgi:hypothetical protein
MTINARKRATWQPREVITTSPFGWMWVPERLLAAVAQRQQSAAGFHPPLPMPVISETN